MKVVLKNSRAVLASVFAAALISAALSSNASAQTAGSDEREKFEHGFEDGHAPWVLPSGTSRAEADELQSRWKALGAELKSNAGGGDYRSGGEMRHHFLRWSPGGGFVYLYVYEIFAVLDFSYGRVTVTPSEVVFTIEREQRGENGVGARNTTPRRWVAARWGRRDYMIPVGQMADFGNYVGGRAAYNNFNGPCCGFAPFLSNRRAETAAGEASTPVVPAAYRRFIKRPIEATITSAGRRRVVKDYTTGGELFGQYYERASLTPVRINAGRRHGVRRLLLFRLVGVPGEASQYLKITRVGPAHSAGVVVRTVYDDGRETYYDTAAPGDNSGPTEKTYPPVAVGTRVTTAPFQY